MRILFISAFYPPHIIGGWEQLTADLDERLRARRHETRVLTSTYGTGSPAAERHVLRHLVPESADLQEYRPRDFLQRRKRVWHNLRETAVAITDFGPDIVFVHGMWNLSRSVPWQAEQLLPERVVYYIASDWPVRSDAHTVYWRDRAAGGLQEIGKRLLAPAALWLVAREQASYPLQFRHVLCVSEAVKRQLAEKGGIPDSRMTVIHNGVETDLFFPAAARNGASELRLLYAGSLAAHKGADTVVAALARLRERPDLKLTIAGAGVPEYEAHLRRLVVEGEIQARVSFSGRVPREEMPALMREHDVLILPSIWEEPLARVVLEALASGLAVVATATGGTPELLVEGKTGLTFAANDDAGLARCLERLADDRFLRERLAASGRREVLARFGMQRMVTAVESYLEGVATGVVAEDRTHR